MICKLCGLDKKLVKAHIIPDFMYSSMYGSKHTLVEVSLDNLNNRKVIQTAHKDKNILCATCDNEVIGSYERYASKILFDESIFKCVINDHGLKSYETTINYREFKLFLLSILWRSSITSLSYFKHISIGKYEEVIRSMLFNNQPYTSDVFPISIIKLEPVKSQHSKVGLDPITTLVSNPKWCVFVLNGFTYSFVLSHQAKDFEHDSFAIKEDNLLIIPVLEGKEAIEHINTMAAKEVLKA
jgi:hypothetical protein